MTAQMLTRRASLLALSLGSGAMVAGVGIRPAEAGEHCSVQTALEGVGRTNRLRELYETGGQVGVEDPNDRSTLQASLEELRQQDNIINKEDYSWLSEIFDSIEHLSSGAVEVAMQAYSEAQSIYEEIEDDLGIAARAVAAVFMDGFEYLQDRYEDLIQRVGDPRRLIGWLVRNVRMAMNGLLASAAILRVLGISNPAFLALGGLIAAAAEALSTSLDYHYPRQASTE